MLFLQLFAPVVGLVSIGWYNDNSIINVYCDVLSASMNVISVLRSTAEHDRNESCGFSTMKIQLNLWNKLIHAL